MGISVFKNISRLNMKMLSVKIGIPLLQLIVSVFHTSYDENFLTSWGVDTIIARDDRDHFIVMGCNFAVTPDSLYLVGGLSNHRRDRIDSLITRDFTFLTDISIVHIA